MKSSRSIHTSPQMGTLRSPISGFCGWLEHRTWSSGSADQFSSTTLTGSSTAMRRGDVAVEEIADLELQQRDVGGAVELGDADAFAEIADGRGRVAAAAQAGDRRQARIVPAADVAFLDELQQLALAHHRVGEVEPREFDLARLGGHRAVVDEPIVKRPVVLELQRAERVGDVLERVLQRMGEVIHRIDAPGVAGVVVLGVHDPIEHRIAQVHVGRRHVDLGAQHALAFLELAGPHPGEQVEVFLHRAVAARRVGAGRGEVAALRADFLGRCRHRHRPCPA